jgi:cell division septum initiation protein DivIVA
MVTHSHEVRKNKNKNGNQEKYLNEFLDDVSIMIDETSY